MCNKITKISTQNRFQWIGICSHGIAHVFWRTTQICLPVNELEVFMNKALAGKLPVECFGDEYLLWLNRIAIRLTEDDYYEIQELFAFASKEKTIPSAQSEMSSQKVNERVSEKGQVVLH